MSKYLARLQQLVSQKHSPDELPNLPRPTRVPQNCLPEALPKPPEPGFGSFGSPKSECFPPSKRQLTIIIETPADSLEKADRRNREALAAGLTDCFCASGLRADTAWRVSGREIWSCFDCGKPADTDPPVQGKWKPAKAPKPAKTLIKVDPKWTPDPVPEPSQRWWEAPVEGWADGRVGILNIARDEVVEIDIKEGGGRISKRRGH